MHPDLQKLHDLLAGLGPRRALAGPSDQTASRGPFDDGQIRSILLAGKRNEWIQWDEIGHATLKRGIMDHSLHLDLVDPTPREKGVKFLWLKVDGGFDLLETTLVERLGDRFKVVRRPIG